MCLINKIKKILIFILIFFFNPGISQALNLFEMFMIKTGVALVYYQYNDNSLNFESDFSKKNDVLINFNQNRILRIKSDEFKNLPIQQQLLVIEELNLQK